MAESRGCPSSMSDEDPTKHCDPCKFRGLHKQAGTHCQECSEYLCDSCEEIHLSFKATRDHELKPIDDSSKLSLKQRTLISTTMRCDVHPAETFTLFCEDHSEPSCRLCKKMKHRNCNIRNLKDIAEDSKTKQDVVTYMQKLKTLKSEFDEINQFKGKSKKSVVTCSIEFKRNIAKMKRDIIDWADRMEHDMLDKLADTERELTDDIDKHMKTADEMTTQLNEVSEMFEVLGQDSIDVAFVIMMKYQEMTDGIGNVKLDIQTETKPTNFRLEPSSCLLEAISEIKEMGTLHIVDKTVDNADIRFHEISSLTKRLNIGEDADKTVDNTDIRFLEISSLTKRLNIDEDCASGCTFMPNGELVTCGNDSVKVFTYDFKLKMKLDSLVWDVAMITKDEVIVTLPFSKSLQVLTVSGNLERGKSFSVDMECWGVDCKNDMIYVSCRSQTGNGGEIKVLTMTGVTLNTFKINQECPVYLAVNGSGDRILIGTRTPIVLCTDMTGKVLYTYNDSELRWSCGVMFDNHDNVMVCGCSSDNIHVVNRDGTKHRVILTSDDGMSYPQSIAYRACDRTLVVGQDSSCIAFTVNQ